MYFNDPIKAIKINWVKSYRKINSCKFITQPNILFLNKNVIWNQRIQEVVNICRQNGIIDITI